MVLYCSVVVELLDQEVGNLLGSGNNLVEEDKLQQKEVEVGNRNSDLGEGGG